MIKLLANKQNQEKLIMNQDIEVVLLFEKKSIKSKVNVKGRK